MSVIPRLRAALLVGIISAVNAADAAPAGPGPAPDFLRLYAETRAFTLGRPVAARPTPDGKAVLFLRSPPRSPELSLYELDVATGQTRVLLTPGQLLPGDEKLSPAERARRERQRVSFRGFTSFELSDDGALVLVTLSGHLYTLRRQGGVIARLPTGDEAVLDPRLSPDGKKVAYVKERDLYVLDLGAARETRLTTSSDAKITNGLAEFVAQEELDRHRGFWWSPDSQRLAFEEADSRALETFHLGDVLHPEQAAEAVPYPRPGKANATLRLGVLSAVAGAGPPVTWIDWDHARFPYLAQVSWREGGPLTFVVLSRVQRDLEVRAVDATGGHSRLLLAEHDDHWINLDQTTPRWLPGGSGFLWSSERSGRRQLELRDAAGALVRALGPTDAEYVSLADVDEGARQVYCHAAPEPTQQHLYALSLDGSGAPRPLTSEPGLHTALFGSRHQLFALTSTTLSQLPHVAVHAVAGARLAELPATAAAPPFVPGAEIVTAGSESFHVAIVRPRGFAKGQRLPVVVDVYGGPHHLSVTRAMQLHLMRQWIADHGFIVVAIDGRGTPRRGRAWERAIAGSFAKVTLDDQVTALTALARSHPELDMSRVGIYGWSFGGYMAALAVMRRPDVFRVAVAGAPVVDWRDYDTAYTERYLGLPDDNRAAYDESSLLTHAPRLERPLLLIHGTRDDNVYFFHTLKLADALFRAGKHFELLPLSGLTHMVPDPVVREQLYGRILSTLTRALHPR